jgi:IclR family transcriptional regulator, pca regulon regulatory protein
VESDRSVGVKRIDGDFVEALARGLDVITAFGPTALELSVSDVAARTGLARPTARRLLLTLEQLGYARQAGGRFSLTTRILDLGTAYVAAQGLWDIARPHLTALVEQTHESSSMSQLDGSDIVYVARLAVPKIIAMSVNIGTRFPAIATSMGLVMLADLEADALDQVLAVPSRSGVIPRLVPARSELDELLTTVRNRGWAASDERLSVGIRSVSAPVYGSDGRVMAAVNVTVHAAETTMDRLLGEHLPLLLDAAAAMSGEWANRARLPMSDAGSDHR